MAPEIEIGSASARVAGRTAGVHRSHWSLLLLVFAAAGASGYLGARWAAEDLRAELALRPPVVLFNMVGTVRGVAPDRLAAVVAREKARAERLAENGLVARCALPAGE